MAKKILVSYNFSLNEIQNAVAHVLAADPSSPVPGQFYYNSTIGRLKYRGASAWIDPTDRSTHSGTQTAATISDFNTAVRTSRLDQMAAPAAAVAINGQRLTNVASATVNTDAPNWGQVQTAIDNARAGLSVKDPVRVAAQANVSLTAPGATIDGASMAVGQRFLAPVQTTGTQNGIYVWNGAAVPATRPTDADTEGKVIDGTIVAVQEGTDAGKQYVQRAASTGAPGTWTQDWGIYTTGGASYTAGNGLTAAGNDFSVGAGTGITVGADSVGIDTAVVPRKHLETIGDNSSTAITVTHNLGTMDITYSIRDASTNEVCECDVKPLNNNQAEFKFTQAPATNSLKVVIHA